MELILKEKDFRAALDKHDWGQYEGKNLAVYCSTDAIIPVWAWMLVTTKAEGLCNQIFMGDADAFIRQFYIDKLSEIDAPSFENLRNHKAAPSICQKHHVW